MMTVQVYVVGEAPVRLWGLTTRERLQRELASEDVAFVDQAAELQGHGVVLFLGNLLYDNRVVKRLLTAPNTVLEDDNGHVVALHGESISGDQALAILEDQADCPDFLKKETPESLCGTVNTTLLKHEKPRIIPIDEKNHRLLEQHLFDGSYKGVTDLVTKWLWPHLAIHAVRFCVNKGIRPNHVTSLSWVLAILAGLLFYRGDFALGLLPAWLMTFLDTVDGKLARVTVTSSPFGHLFDHILDLIHPPLWYLAWGLGLSLWHPGFSLETSIWLIFGGYILGRVFEGGFQALASFSIFSWRPVDSYSRLITARRNPCLLILTVSLLLGAPDWGLAMVALWTVISTVFLLVRLLQAMRLKQSGQPLCSWLQELTAETREQSVAARIFAGRSRLS